MKESGNLLPRSIYPSIQIPECFALFFRCQGVDIVYVLHQTGGKKHPCHLDVTSIRSADKMFLDVILTSGIGMGGDKFIFIR